MDSLRASPFAAFASLSSPLASRIELAGQPVVDFLATFSPPARLLTPTRDEAERILVLGCQDVTGDARAADAFLAAFFSVDWAVWPARAFDLVSDLAQFCRGGSVEAQGMGSVAPPLPKTRQKAHGDFLSAAIIASEPMMRFAREDFLLNDPEMSLHAGIHDPFLEPWLFAVGDWAAPERASLARHTLKGLASVWTAGDDRLRAAQGHGLTRWMDASLRGDLLAAWTPLTADFGSSCEEDARDLAAGAKHSLATLLAAGWVRPEDLAETAMALLAEPFFDDVAASGVNALLAVGADILPDSIHWSSWESLLRARASGPQPFADSAWHPWQEAHGMWLALDEKRSLDRALHKAGSGASPAPQGAQRPAASPLAKDASASPPRAPNRPANRI